MSKSKNHLGGFSNFVGGIGYISVTMQWIWSGIPILYPLTKNQTFQSYFMPSPQTITPVDQVEPTALSSGVEIALIIFAVAFAIGIMAYVILFVPRKFGRGGNVVTKKSAEKIIPVITNHKKITKEERRTLISQISWSIKALLVFIPVFLLFIAVPESLRLTQEQFIIAGLAVAVGSMLLFLAQFALSKLARLPKDKIW